MPMHDQNSLARELQVNLVQNSSKCLGINIKLRGTVGDLIDHNTHSWKVDLVRSIYPPSESSEILQIPIAKTDSVQDKLFWKYSNDGEYKVKSAYEILVSDCSTTQRQTQSQEGVWKMICGVKVPLKINTFVWKLMHDRLPTLLSLNNKGITTQSLCPFCNEEDESTTQLFMLCPFTRACWHGLALAIHSFDFNNTIIQQWLTSLLNRYKKREVDSMEYLQAIFTTPWTIWNHRNRVVHEGINPNPMDVILTALSLSCRYKESFNEQPNYNSSPGITKAEQQPAAVNMEGVRIFYGVVSSAARSTRGAMFEAMVEAGFRASNHGFQQILILGDSRRVVQAFRKKAPDWLDKTKLADLNFLTQTGLICNVFLVPHFIVKPVWSIAKMACRVPMNLC
uniref:Reverse transcriptase zinc-binding domain-containing protein n=1 Tax=Quercus lobata TaxID=97700 RepID=A0A7N2MUY6_QUELO